MHFSERQKHLPPNFMMENLFQDLYGVDAPAHWEAYRAPRSPMPRVKMILALGYWVLPNMFQYWVVLGTGNTFIGCHTQYQYCLDTLITVASR